MPTRAKHSWQEILDARGYIVIVPIPGHPQPITIGKPLSWTVTSSEFKSVKPGSLVPIAETDFADFLEQVKLYRDKAIWCGEKDRYYRCVAE